MAKMLSAAIAALTAAACAPAESRAQIPHNPNWPPSFAVAPASPPRERTPAAHVVREVRTMKTTAAAAVAPLLLAAPAAAQEVAFSGATWLTEGDVAEFTTFAGEEALRLSEAAALLQDVELENGIIEFDIAFPDQRGFAGVGFRFQGDGNYEHFYLRPHQSGMPDANQYTPVVNGNSGWQIYYGPRYSVPVDYRYDAWMHVKLVIAGDEADVYVDSEEPVLHVADLKRDQAAGGILLSSYFTGAYFANVVVTPDADAETVGAAEPAPERRDDLVAAFEVSPPVSFAEIESAGVLPDVDAWTPLAVETNGVANLGRTARRTEEADAVLARIVIEADAAETRRVRFGYSDDVIVFVNGEPVYSGTNAYRSRDYRYLGTVGLFDAVHAALAPGRNEIVFAVRENFGGWAVMAAVDE
jgi:hypothetical protein